MKIVTTNSNPRVTSETLYHGKTTITVQTNEFQAQLDVVLTREQLESMVREIFIKLSHPDQLLADINTIVNGKPI